MHDRTVTETGTKSCGRRRAFQQAVHFDNQIIRSNWHQDNLRTLQRGRKEGIGTVHKRPRGTNHKKARNSPLKSHLFATKSRHLAPMQGDRCGSSVCHFPLLSGFLFSVYIDNFFYFRVKRGGGRGGLEGFFPTTSCNIGFPQRGLNGLRRRVHPPTPVVYLTHPTLRRTRHHLPPEWMMG